MRFLFIAPRFHSNQADLVRMLISKGHSVDFIAMGSSASEDHSILKPRILKKTLLGNFINRIFNKKNEFYLYSILNVPNFFQLYKWLFEISPDVIVMRGFLSITTFLSLPYFLFKSRIVIYTQGPKYRSDVSLKLKIYYFIAFKVFRFKWFTPVRNKVTENDSIVGIENERIKFIPFFKRIDEKVYPRTYQLEKPRFLAIGKYQIRKNFLNLLDAFSIILKKRECTLTLIGENTTYEHTEYLEKIKEKVQQLDLNDKVFIYENKSFEFVQSQYYVHDIFIMPSYNEPASISQIEAMAHGLPIICCYDNGTAHYVIPKINGLRCGSSVVSLVSAIEDLLSKPDNIVNWGKGSIELLESEFNINKSYDNLIQMCFFK